MANLSNYSLALQSSLRTEEYFRERAERANLADMWDILSRVPDGEVIGDELPEGYEPIELGDRPI